MVIESIAPLPGQSGYAVTFNNALEQSHVDAFGRVQGYHYRSTPPKLRFAIRFSRQDDPYTLNFVCSCTDDPLMQDELLALLKEFRLVPTDASELPLSTGRSAPDDERQHLQA